MPHGERRLAQAVLDRRAVDAALDARGEADIVDLEDLVHVAGRDRHDLVERGLGISILPELATPPSGHPTIVTRPIKDPEVKRTIGLIERRSARLSPAAQKFRDMLAEKRRL